MSKKIKFNIFFLLILLHLSLTSSKVAIEITKVNFPSPFCDPTDELVTLTFFCISCSSSSTLSSTFYFKDNNQNIIECKIPSSISDKTFQELNCKIKVPASSTSTSLFMNGSELLECKSDGTVYADKEDNIIYRIYVKMVKESVESISICNSPCLDVKESDIDGPSDCNEVKTSNEDYFPYCCYLKYKVGKKTYKKCVELKEEEKKESKEYIKNFEENYSIESTQEDTDDEDNDEDKDKNNNNNNNNNNNKAKDEKCIVNKLVCVGNWLKWNFWICVFLFLLF